MPRQRGPARAYRVPMTALARSPKTARPLFAAMTKNTGRQFVIDNKGGAGGTLGAGVAARAAADGHNFFMGAVHHAIAPAMYPKLDYNIETEFVPVGLVSSVPQVIVVNPQRVQARTSVRKASSVGMARFRKGWLAQDGGAILREA